MKNSLMIDITLDDSTVILNTDYYISGSGNSEFDVKTFRNKAWIEHFITYSKNAVEAERGNRRKQSYKKN